MSTCWTKTGKSSMIFNSPTPKIARGPMRWYTLEAPSTDVPEHFYVALSFNPEQTKGIYLGLDDSIKESHSFIGCRRLDSSPSTSPPIG